MSTPLSPSFIPHLPSLPSVTLPNIGLLILSFPLPPPPPPPPPLPLSPFPSPSLPLPPLSPYSLSLPLPFPPSLPPSLTPCVYRCQEGVTLSSLRRYMTTTTNPLLPTSPSLACPSLHSRSATMLAPFSTRHGGLWRRTQNKSEKSIFNCSVEAL